MNVKLSKPHIELDNISVRSSKTEAPAVKKKLAASNLFTPLSPMPQPEQINKMINRLSKVHREKARETPDETITSSNNTSIITPSSVVKQSDNRKPAVEMHMRGLQKVTTFGQVGSNSQIEQAKEPEQFEMGYEPAQKETKISTTEEIQLPNLNFGDTKIFSISEVRPAEENKSSIKSASTNQENYNAFTTNNLVDDNVQIVPEELLNKHMPTNLEVNSQLLTKGLIRNLKSRNNRSLTPTKSKHDKSDISDATEVQRYSQKSVSAGVELSDNEKSNLRTWEKQLQDSKEQHNVFGDEEKKRRSSSSDENPTPEITNNLQNLVSFNNTTGFAVKN